MSYFKEQGNHIKGRGGLHFTLHYVEPKNNQINNTTCSSATTTVYSLHIMPINIKGNPVEEPKN